MCHRLRVFRMVSMYSVLNYHHVVSKFVANSTRNSPSIPYIQEQLVNYSSGNYDRLNFVDRNRTHEKVSCLFWERKRNFSSFFFWPVVSSLCSYIVLWALYWFKWCLTFASVFFFLIFAISTINFAPEIVQSFRYSVSMVSIILNICSVFARWWMSVEQNFRATFKCSKQKGAVKHFSLYF